MRRFEQEEGGVTKYWQIDVAGGSFTAVWGKVGSGSRNQRVRKFPSAEKCEAEAEKQIAEKLRAGFAEVGVDGSAAPAPRPPVQVDAKAERASKPRAAPAPPLPPLTPRPRRAASPLGIAAATMALRALTANLGRRSWVVSLQARRARRALERIAGLDPAADAELAAAFDELMTRVVEADEGGLPLRRALELLLELDCAAFVRALAIWQAGYVTAAITTVGAGAEALGEPELALRLGALLCGRAGDAATERAWTRRWQALEPYVALKTGSIAELRAQLAEHADAQLQQRLARLA